MAKLICRFRNAPKTWHHGNKMFSPLVGQWFVMPFI